MIRMTRLRLINWHNFVDDLIDFQNVTYMIGVNAVGKTTIMDAIRYCLTTNKNFNAAGNQRSGRTLQGSVHGKQRGEDIYLRRGRTVAYIGVEFLDEASGRYQVIAVRVESESPAQELRHVMQDWYITKPGHQLEDMPFLDANRVPTSREQFKLPERSMQRAATQKDARQRICMALGIGDADSNLGKKFYDVFHMGTSLAEIADIRDFIYAYILPEPVMNLDVLQRDMQELENLQDVLIEARNRSTLLAGIAAALDRAQELENRVQINKGLILYAQFQRTLGIEARCVEIIEATNQAVAGYEKKHSEAKLLREEAQDDYYRAKSRETESEENKALEYLRDRHRHLEHEYKRAVERQDALRANMAALTELVGDLARHTIQVNWDEPAFWRMDTDGRRAKLEKLQSAVREAGEMLRKRLVDCQMDIRTADEEMQELKGKIDGLKKGNMPYPPEATLVKDMINEELARHGMEQDARIFCELLLVTDTDWQPCIEAALGARRFDIIVQPRHYLAAKRAFMALGSRVRSIALINTGAVERDMHNKAIGRAGYLSAKLKSENHYACLYAESLLGSYMCCEDAEQLEDHRRSVTKDLLRYQGYRLQRLHKQDEYIGQDARKKMLDRLSRRFEELEGRLRSDREQYALLEATDIKQRDFIGGKTLQAITLDQDAPQQVEKRWAEIENTAREIHEYENNPLLQMLFDQTVRCKKVMDDHEDDMRRWDQLIGQEEGKHREAIETQSRNMEEQARAEEAYAAFSAASTFLMDEVHKKYTVGLKTSTVDAMIRNQTEQHTRFRNELSNYIQNELTPMQRQYGSTYHTDYPVGPAGAESYRDAYVHLVNIDLERHIENLRVAQVRCKERFRKDILFRMKDDIENAQHQPRELRKIMARLEYGEERYQFLLAPGRDPELNDFYRIIMDESNTQIAEADELGYLAATHNQAYEQQVEELMGRIMQDIELSAQARAGGRKMDIHISRYVDYRTYLEYDIQVENTVTGITVPLSKVSGDSSGGENQAPYYVAICASLLQIYQHSPNSIRLVLLDEAFNKMTSDRIAPMMRMFSQMDLQLVLISTAEKCSDIYPYCDIIYSIIKAGSRNSIKVFEKESA